MYYRTYRAGRLEGHTPGPQSARSRHSCPDENGGTVLIDGFNTRVQRPHVSDVRRERYSGKNKQFALNTILYTNVHKIILGIWATIGGRRTDIRVLRAQSPRFGRRMEIMRDLDTPTRDRINVDADS